ncbi:MAG: HpcH/HpaI aldolase/citrate lyase family protein [Sphingomonas sp.]
MTSSEKPCRSALFLPASNARAIDKVRGLPCDALILDLEDAVAPEAKEAARSAAVAAFSAGGFGARLRVLRVNAIDSDWGADDLAAAAALDIDAVLVPKVSTGTDIARYDAALTAASRDVALWAMIETCRAVAALQAIADMAPSTRLGAFVVGTNDLALEMRVRPMPNRVNLLPVLTLAVAAARSRGLRVLDGVRNDFVDLAAFSAEAEQGAALGFDGKSLIHPAQIAPCNAAFSPSADDLARARSIVAAFGAPDAAGRGAVRLDGRMVERLHLREAERVLAMAARIG